MKSEIRRTLNSSTFQSLLMSTAMIVAGGFDALVNVISARMLTKEQFSVFVAVTALVQVLVHLTNVIRNVVAYYTAEMTVQENANGRIAAFFRRNWRWAWRWGVISTGVMLLLSPFIARFIRIDSPWPLWAASLALVMLFVRPVTDGTLQGIQQFIGLSSVQVLQSFLRLLYAVVLIILGLAATGAVLALPLATTTALLVAIWFLRGQFRETAVAVQLPQISLRYTLYTMLGLLAYALLVNVDAIAVKRFFSETVTGDYGTVVTLGKITLFATLGLGLVLFPKATQRHAAGRDPRPVLLMALGATFLLGLILTAIYFAVPGLIVQTIFSDTYTDPGPILGLVGIATTLFAGINIWLNYALSLERHAFVIALALIVILEIVALFLFHDTLMMIVTTMIVTGLIGNVAGAVTTLRPSA